MTPTATPQKITVVGMHGFARSGKDTAAAHMTTGRGFTRFAFADNLRAELQFLDPFINGTVRFRDAPHTDEANRLVTDFAELIEATGGDIALAGAAAAALNPYIDGTYRHTEMVNDFDGDWDAIKADLSLNGEPRELQRKHGTEVRRDLFREDFWTNYLEQQIIASGLTRVVVSDVRFPNEGDWVHAFGGIVLEVVRDGATGGNHASDKRMPVHLIDATLDNNGTRSELAGLVDEELFNRGITSFRPSHATRAA